jgi:transformer-2 protein
MIANPPSKTVYISNLSYHRDQTGVKNLFSRYGKIKQVTIILDPVTKQSKGMAFVEMNTAEEAKLAIAGLDKQIIDGRTLKTKYAFQQRNPENNTYVPNPKNKKNADLKSAPKKKFKTKFKKPS